MKIVGIGPGDSEYILPIAVQAMREADLIIAAKRVIPMLNELLGESKTILAMPGIEATLELLEREQKSKEVVLAVSGDPLMYSLFRTLKKSPQSAKLQIEVIPGIGSLQMLGARCGISMEEAKIISVHGRTVTRGAIAMAVCEHSACFFLCSKEQGPVWLADIMLEYGLEAVKIYVGAKLSYDSERLISGSPAEIRTQKFSGLCVALIQNEQLKKRERAALLQDADFIRGKIPMTKAEVRAIIIQKLNLQPDSLVWDVGAGTGSVTIECARFCPFGEVYAIEREKAALSLIEQNIQKFKLKNIKLYAGEAQEEMKKLPCPDRVFIGGSGGDLEEIVDYLASFQAEIKVVISAVTVETLIKTCNCLEKYDKNYEMVQISIGKSRKLGRYHIMEPNNPVTIIEAKLEKGGEG